MLGPRSWTVAWVLAGVTAAALGGQGRIEAALGALARACWQPDRPEWISALRSALMLVLGATGALLLAGGGSAVLGALIWRRAVRRSSSLTAEGAAGGRRPALLRWLVLAGVALAIAPALLELWRGPDPYRVAADVFRRILWCVAAGAAALAAMELYQARRPG